MLNNELDLGRKAYVVLVAVLGWLALTMPSAQAVPSMARQTGYECAKCHTVFPELTPFGRDFKLGGFSQTSKNWGEVPLWKRLPVSGALQGSWTQTRNTDTVGATSDDFPRNSEVTLQTAAVYWGGKIVDNAGALIQYGYDGIERVWALEMFDARYGNDTSVAGKELAWGVSMNNSPTLSDIYNSTPMWAFPYTDSAAITPAAVTLIDKTLASQVGGVTAYGLWNEMVYGEFGGYGSANSGFFRFMGLGVPTETIVDGTAPYWRFAFQKQKGPHSFEVGTYGMVANVFADNEEQGLGSNRFRDLALDASYQYITDDHQISAHVNWISEKQDWNASFSRGLSSSPSTNLNTLQANLLYYFRRKFGGGVQYFQTTGSTNDLLYNTGAPVTGSANGSPNSKGWVVEVDFLPIQYIKLALRFTLYQKFNGAGSNYDGFGRDASDNNSVFLLFWGLI